MKKILFLLTTIFMLVVSCGSKSENKDSKELNIYSWTYFVPDKVIQDFEKETGIKVNLSFYDNNDTMINRLCSCNDKF